MLDIRTSAHGGLSLHGHCGLDQIEPLVQALAGLLSAQGPVTVDTAEVEDLDTAALQALVAFQAQRAGDTSFVGWNPTLRDRLQRSGFATLI